MESRPRGVEIALASLTRRVGSTVLDILFPIECLQCGKEKEWICELCLRKVPLEEPSVCFVCKQVSLQGKTCFSCKNNFPLEGIFYFLNYDTPLVRRAIMCGKYSYVKTIFPRLIQFLAPHVEAIGDTLEMDPRAFLVVPMPLHPRRFRERCFNQAAILGKEVANILQATYGEPLARVRDTLHQADLNEEDRARNIEKAFVCNNPADVAGKYILLVDDVATTGSTLSACAMELKKAGAAGVWGLVLAKG